MGRYRAAAGTKVVIAHPEEESTVISFTKNNQPVSVTDEEIDRQLADMAAAERHPVRRASDDKEKS